MDICRTCAADSCEELVPIFSKLDDKFIANVIVDCSSVTINEDDGLPSYVCSNCMVSITDILRFAQKVRESDRKLRLLFKDEILPKDVRMDDQESVDESFVTIPLEVDLYDVKQEVEDVDAEEQDSEYNETNVLESEPESNDSEESKDSNWKGDGKTSDEEPLEQKKAVRRRNTKQIAVSESSDQERDTPKRRRRWCPKKVRDDEDDNEDVELDEVEKKTFKLVEADPTRFFCCLCYKDFGTKSELQEHGLKKHSKKCRGVNYSKKYVCNVCHCRYIVKEALEEHLAIAEKIPRRKIYECLRCANRFITAKRRRFHAHNHPLKADIPDSVKEDKRKLKKLPTKGAVSASSDQEGGKPKRRRPWRPKKASDDEDDEDIELDEVEQKIYTRVQAEPGRFFCCLCFKDFATKNELLDHGQQKHSKKTRQVNYSKKYVCDVCHCRYIAKESLEDHLAMAAKLSKRKIYECLRCANRFISAKRRRIHAHQHPKYEEYLDPDLEEKRKREAKCCKKGCHKKFPTREDLLEHGRKEHAHNKPLVKDPAKPHECPVCFKGFEKLQSVKRHGYKMFDACMQCSICGKEFKSRNSMITHERKHTNDKPFPCEICGKRFIIRNQLKNHMAVHQEDKPFGCTECGWSFKRECNLKIHMLQHSDVLPWKCEVCGKCFKGKYHLQYHLRTHTGHKPWKCRYCDKSFADHANRARHETSHTGIKPYKCSFCDKSFIRRRFQIEHESTHTGIKPYRCEMCNRTFSQKTSLKKHLEMHPLAPENQISLAQPSPMPADSPLSPAPLAPPLMPPPSSTAVSSALMHQQQDPNAVAMMAAAVAAAAGMAPIAAQPYQQL